MIDIDDVTAGVLSSGTYEMTARVESWYDGTLLADDIPISSGTSATDVTLNVPESVNLTVPRVDDQGNVWAPNGDIDHPLACWGQRLRISVGVTAKRTGTTLIRRGWFVIHDTTPQGDSVVVNASGLLSLVAEANFVSPVTASGTYGSMVRRLVEPALTVDLTNAPTDRNVASGMVWSNGRLDALQELLDAWPATAYVDEDGVLNVVPVGDTTTSSLTLSDGKDGTAMRWGGAVSRDGAANAVVARGYTSTGADVQAVAFDDNGMSQTFYGGPFNPLLVPAEFFSPLLTTTSECAKAAGTVLARRKRQAARTLSTTAVPYLALQARDGVTVKSDDLGISSTLGIVDQLHLPLTATDGGMVLGVRLSNG